MLEVVKIGEILPDIIGFYKRMFPYKSKLT